MWFLLIFGFVVGLLTGLLTMHKIKSLQTTSGTIVINSIDPEKDVFVLKDIDINALYDKKTIVFKIINEDKNA